MSAPDPAHDGTGPVVTAWSTADLARALSPGDRGAVVESAAVRALIVQLATAADNPAVARSCSADDELFDACAVLGRLFALSGGSPSLAVLTIDHACEALGVPGAHWVGSARAAVVEGFVRALLEGARREALLAWEFPACAVPLSDEALAVAAANPSDDDEVLMAWAARVARAASLAGARRAVVAGPERPRRAVVDALVLVGIDVECARGPG